MRTINMMSAADKVKGQGVGSAFTEQVNLVTQGLGDKYEIFINSKNKCDIIHFHTINPEFWVSINLDASFFAHVGYVHFLPETVEDSLDIPQFCKKIFYKYMIDFYNCMDYLVTVNPYFIGELEKYGIPKEKITYIPNFVSDEQFHPISSEKIYKEKENLGIPNNKFVVLGVGQVQTRKGITDFVETAKNFPDAQFIWAGGFSFGPISEGYKELQKIMYNPPPNVKFTGIIEREEMNSIYNIADVIFLPSFSELFPMTVLEAMCVGKPILLRDLEIYPEILFDFYLKGNNVEDFTKILKQLYSDKKFYDNWQSKSFEGHNFYSKDNILNMWENFYDKVYSESKLKQASLIIKPKKIKISHLGKVKKIYFKNQYTRMKLKLKKSFSKTINTFKISFKS